VGISAKTGKNMDEFYESVFRLAKKVWFIKLKYC
jgi:hypothetical protein